MPRPRKPARAFRAKPKYQFSIDDIVLGGAECEWSDADLDRLGEPGAAAFKAERDAWVAAGRPEFDAWRRFCESVEGIKHLAALTREAKQ